MKKLIVSGCSFTDNYAKTIGLKEWPIWPELLADSLGMELINLGKSGQGNEYIYSSLLDTVIKEKNIGLVIAMWTEFQRLDFFINLKKDPHWTALHFPENEKDRNNISWKNKVMEILHERDLGSDKANIQRSLRIFFMLLFASFFGMSLVISSSNFSLDEKNKSKHKVANSINIPISLFDLIYLYRL